MQSLRLAILLSIIPAALAMAQEDVALTISDDGVKFESRLLMVDANEGIAAGDLDGDGNLDLVAGRMWYRGPNWEARPVRNIKDWNGYVESNGDYLFDVNRDGRLDIISNNFVAPEIRWFENPGKDSLRRGKLWKEHVLVDSGQSKNEGQIMEDLDGDGRPEYIVNSWTKDVPMKVWRLVDIPPAKKGAAAFKMVGHDLGESGNGHGLAVGDINGDGKKDVLVGQGWYQQPANDPWSQPWTFHKDWRLKASLPMIVTDLDQDGDNDLIIGNGHDYGLYWWENLGTDEKGKVKFESHDIDNSFSQAHTLAWADVDGDRKPDLIAGKRVFAHNGSDPGGKEMPCLFYYTWNIETKSFTRYTIDKGQAGCGLQIVAQDLSGDGKTDIAVAGKSGTYVLIAK